MELTIAAHSLQRVEISVWRRHRFFPDALLGKTFFVPVPQGQTDGPSNWYQLETARQGPVPGKLRVAYEWS